MTSSYRDPNVAAALAYQAEQEQRRKAQEQPNLLDIAGRTALGLGAAALAGAGIRGVMRRNAVRPISVEDLGATAARAEENVRRAARSTATPPPSRPAPPAGVARQQAAEEFTRQARAERPAGINQIDLNAVQVVDDLVPTAPKALPAAGFSPADYLTQKGYVEAVATGTPYSASEVAQLSRRPLIDAADRLLEDRDLLKRVEAEEAALVNVQPEIRGEQSRQQAQVRRALSAQADEVIAGIRSEPVGSLVSTQQARTGFNVDQAINALDAAEDQQTGRVKIQLQRNEDVDLGQVEVLEDIASQQRNSMLEMDEPINRVAAQLPDGLPVDQAEGASNAAQEFVSNALNKQRPPRTPLSDIDNKMYDLVATAAESGLKLEPKRALSILTDPNLELTTDEVNLFSINPQIGKFALKGQGYAPGQKQTGGMLSLKGDLLQSIPNIGSDPQSSITQAASGTSIRGRSRVQNQPDEFRQRLDSFGRPVREDVASVDPGGTLTMSTGEELTELDMPEEVTANYRRLTRNPITGQMQEEYAPKGMRAISTAEGKTYYVPTQDPGGVGVYGEERSYASGPTIKFDMPEQGRVAGAYTKAATRRPTDMPFTERTQGGSRFTGLNNDQLNAFIENAPEGKVREAGMRELAGRQGLKISEALRRGNIEGRDPQMILKQFGIGT